MLRSYNANGIKLAISSKENLNAMQQFTMSVAERNNIHHFCKIGSSKA